MDATVIDRKRRDFQEALRAARIGVPDAQYQVGLMYAHGMGVGKSLEKAVDWIRKAAERGLQPAQYLLATRYELGIGVNRDMRLALSWFEKAAHGGHAKAMYKLAKFFAPIDGEASEKLLLEAANAGLADAQHSLGLSFAAKTGSIEDAESALHWLTSAAEQDHAPAQFALGNLYTQGSVAPRNMDVARAWLRQAAKHDFPAAQLALEILDADQGRAKTRSRSRKKFVSGDRRHSDKRWGPVFDSGDADARYHLGLMYESGMGVDQDLKKAQWLYQLAAKAGDVRAQVALAKLLEKQSFEDAVNWYRRAARHGSEPARHALGSFALEGRLESVDVIAALADVLPSAANNEQNALMEIAELINNRAPDVVSACYARAAEAGSADAQFELANAFTSGTGVSQDFKRAFKWYLQAAQKDHTKAQVALAAMFLEGRGVKVDVGTALTWFLRAAEKGDPQAQWNVGSIYASGGDGVPADMKQAFEWCKCSAEQGFAPAQASLGALYFRLGKYEMAELWWHKASAFGDAEAKYNLAQLMLKGLAKGGVVMAFELLWQAAEAGLVAAQSRLAIAYASGRGTAQDPVEAHKWFHIAALASDPAAIENLGRSKRLLATPQLVEATHRAEYWMNTHKPIVK